MGILVRRLLNYHARPQKRPDQHLNMRDHYQKRWMLLTCCGVFLSAAVYGQKITDAHLSEANVLRQAFSDARVAALQATTVYDFEYDQATHTLIAKERETEQYVALRPNATLVCKNHFNDKSYIESYALRSEKGHKLEHDKYCGHYESGDIFYSDAQVCAYHLTMDLTGRAASFESTTVYSDIRYLTHLFFHQAVPAKERTLILNVPDWVTLDLVEMNFEGYDIEKAVTPQKGFTQYTYHVKNLPAYPNAAHMPGYLHFLPNILILTRAYQHEGKDIKVLSSTDDLYQWYASITAKVKHEDATLTPLVTKLIKDQPTGLDKMKALYYWVQDNIQYIAFEDGLAAFKPEDAPRVLYNRYGDCKGMANLLKDMLTLAGFDARLTWIGTRRIPYDHTVPSLGVDNHMVCTVFYNDTFYVLDATEKYNPFGTYAERIQGREVMIEDGNAYLLKHVPAEPLENYLQESSWRYQLADEHLQGTGQTKVNGEQKKILLNIVQQVKEQDRDKFVRHLVAGKANPDAFTLTTPVNFHRDEDLRMAYTMNLPDQVSAFEKELYIDMDFEDTYKGSTVEETRHEPYDFGTRSFTRVTAELAMPAGHTLEHLPKPFQFANDYFSFDAHYEASPQAVRYVREIKILKNMLPVSQFPEWNNAIQGLTRFYDDQIILKAQ